MIYSITTQFVEGDYCEVLNYRRPQGVWEHAKIYQVTADLRPDGSHYLSYHVTLLRKSERGRPLRLKVAINGVRPI